MAKKKYTTVWMDLNPSGEDIIPIDPSQGTSGDDPQFTWDPNIDPDDIEMFWASYDETDLAGIDSNGDLYISYDEFMAWYNAEQPW